MLHHFLRIALGLLFVATGLSKLFDLPGFADNLADFGIVPDNLVVPAAWSVCLAELVAGSGLALNIRGSLAMLTLLLALFLGVLSYGIALGLDIDCGCLGSGYHVDLKTQLIIDVGLVVWCSLVYWSRGGRGTKPVSVG